MYIWIYIFDKTGMDQCTIDINTCLVWLSVLFRTVLRSAICYFYHQLLFGVKGVIAIVSYISYTVVLIWKCSECPNALWQTPLLKYSKARCTVLLWYCYMYECICWYHLLCQICIGAIGDCILDIYWFIIGKEENGAVMDWARHIGGCCCCQYIYITWALVL